MKPDRALVHARRRAGLTQRALAQMSGVAQPTIARIERAVEVPRVDTLARLLGACGDSIEVVRRGGIGVDKSLIRSILALTPGERLVGLAEEAAALDRLGRARQVGATE